MIKGAVYLLNQLKRIYPSAIPYKDSNPDGYIWFFTDNNDCIGIHNVDLTIRDIELLSVFLKQYNSPVLKLTNSANQWINRINQSTNESAKNPYRFVYFLTPEGKIKSEVFQNALNELFNDFVPILWITETEGILVETIPFPESRKNYEQFIHTFISDLSVKIRFYVGEIRKTYVEIKEYYENTLTQAEIVLSESNEEVISYAEGTIFTLLNNTSIEEKEKIASSILKEFKNDSEMLKTLEIFFDSDLNISETSKKMYLHRNSVHYRIDKFMNETGINIQNFNEAIAVKIALSILN